MSGYKLILPKKQRDLDPIFGTIWYILHTFHFLDFHYQNQPEIVKWTHPNSRKGNISTQDVFGTKEQEVQRESKERLGAHIFKTT